jgi:hypothetical protein
MKRFLLAIIPFFVVLTTSASNVEKIQFANQGDFSLGVTIGIPPESKIAVMPTYSIDGMWGLKEGFVKTEKFGENGAVDLGVYANLTLHYHGTSCEKDPYWSIPIAIRSGFHWEFVKKLDVYAGLQGGVTLSKTWHGVKVDSDVYTDGILGVYAGVKWMFTKVFGVKAEYSVDWLGEKNNMPPFAGGVTFNF